MQLSEYKLRANEEECPICGQIAFHRHFGGVRSCKGWRTVLHFRSYKCSRNEKCFSIKGHNKHGCRGCRFKRCLQMGMQISAVSTSTRTLKKDIHSYKIGSLKHIMRSWNSCYVNWHKVMLEFNGNNTTCFSQTNSRILTNFYYYKRSTQMEAIVFKEYVNNFCSLAIQDTYFKVKLQLNFISTWTAIRLLSVNLKLNSFWHNRIYFLDETFMEMQFNKYLDFYQQHPNLWSAETMAKSLLRLTNTLNMTCKRFSQMRVSDTEFGVCTYYLLIKSASKLKPQLSEEMRTNQIFNDLMHYYKQEFEDVAERFGNLMLVLELISEFKNEFEEHQILLALNQRDDNLK